MNHHYSYFQQHWCACGADWIIVSTCISAEFSAFSDKKPAVSLHHSGLSEPFRVGGIKGLSTGNCTDRPLFHSLSAAFFILLLCSLSPNYSFTHAPVFPGVSPNLHSSFSRS